MRQLPSLPAIVAFEAAARHESFREASVELHLTPSAISHQVRNLEAWFGRRLFVREPRQLTLTDDGQRLLAEVAPALDAIDAACAVLRPKPRRSQLAVHCSPSFATKWLGPRLPQFMKAHPTLAIRLSSSAEPANLARDTSIDVGIAYGTPPSEKGVVVESLGVEVTAPLCSPSLLPGRRQVKAADVMSLVLIESQLNPVSWADWCKHNGLQLPRQQRPSFDRGFLSVAAAVDGMGVALETARFAQAEVARGDLITIVGPGLRPIQQPLHFLFYRASQEASPELSIFVAWLKRELGC